MTAWANPQLVGTTGATGVETDVVADLGDGLWIVELIGVTLTQAYHPIRQPGYPTRNSPGHMLMPGMTLQSGATVWLLKPEADALVALGAATYSNMPAPVAQVPQPLPPIAPAPYYAPVCSGPSGTGPANVGDTLACDQGTWQHGPTDFAYQWQRYQPPPVFAVGPIAGATASNYVTTPDDDGAYVFCDVTGSNSAGSADQDSNFIWVTSTGAAPAKREGAKR
jgi:hypothetical protein